MALAQFLAELEYTQCQHQIRHKLPGSRRLGIPDRKPVLNGRNRTTAPNPAPPATSPLPYANRPRTAGLWLCNECGQSWDITATGGAFVAGDAAVPRHCPTCGSATLTRTLSTFNGLECGAIKALRVERLLAQLLYEHWAATCTPNNRSTPGTLTT
jgi:hypothetical protein